jgi:hypothetical protein
VKPTLGIFEDGLPGPSGVAIDLPRLLETRMLVQCNSGGGKSWTIRRLLEQTAGQVQQLVIDPEGEFATLREKHDFVIAAPHDGDALAHPKTAALLARRLLETGVSAILDIYDLKAHERQAFVRIFLEALVNAPKALWRPALIVLDEAHVFCPESARAESAGAVIDLATRGRKRGFALIAATQRLAKLHKDAAAECLNKLVGRTGLDVDVKRAADELGFTAREAMDKLRQLAPGEFFAFGPALSPQVRPLRIGPVSTTHPKAGDRTLRAPPKPTAAIVAVLPKLSDLPKEAEAEAQSIADLKRELANARRELTRANTTLPGPSFKDLDNERNEGYLAGEHDTLAVAKGVFTHVENALIIAVRKECADAIRLIGPMTATPTGALKPGMKVTGRGIKPGTKIVSGEPPTWMDDKSKQMRKALDAMHVAGAEGLKRGSAPRAGNGAGHTSATLNAAQRKFLTVLAQRQGKATSRNQVALFAGYSSKSAHVDNVLSSLRAAAYAEGRRGDIRITDAGLAALGEFEPLPSGDRLRDYWMLEAGGAAEAAFLKVVFEAYPGSLTRDEIAQRAGYSTTSAHVDNVLSRLRSLDLITGGRSAISASGELFE